MSLFLWYCRSVVNLLLNIVWFEQWVINAAEEVLIEWDHQLSVRLEDA